jgi:mannose-6-phosphate isomerase-like protein (cupin superfamily)
MQKLAFALLLVSALSVSAISQNAAPSSSTQNRAAEVKYFPKDQVAASFEKGGILLKGANYQILTAQRQEPGQVEVHTKMTDVFYVVEGNATIVVGGQMVGGKPTEPDELRGTSIDGGETHQLSAGDVLMIPAGVPHWINKVQPPFHYFVVKVEATKP